MKRTKGYKRQTFDAAIMTSARTIARLERRARELRRQLKETGEALRVEKKNMRALVSAHKDSDQAPPLRQFGEKQGEG